MASAGRSGPKRKFTVKSTARAQLYHGQGQSRARRALENNLMRPLTCKAGSVRPACARWSRRRGRDGCRTTRWRLRGRAVYAELAKSYRWRTPLFMDYDLTKGLTCAHISKLCRRTMDQPRCRMHATPPPPPPPHRSRDYRRLLSPAGQ